MAKSTAKQRKQRATKKSPRKKPQGRPKSTGAGVPLVVRAHPPLIEALDDWIGDNVLSRPEAIRQLVAWALEQAKVKAAEPPPVEEPPPMTMVRRVKHGEMRS